MTDTIRKEFQYNHPISEIWDAITKAEEITAWFLKADFKAEVGYKYQFTYDTGIIHGSVLEVEPVTHLVYSWIVNDTGVETIVKWNLEANNEGTLLTIEHSGISNYPTEEMATNMFNSFSGGWDGCIAKLNNYLNKSEHAKEN